jgi:hypothetical protein
VQDDVRLGDRQLVIEEGQARLIAATTAGVAEEASAAGAQAVDGAGAAAVEAANSALRPPQVASSQ